MRRTADELKNRMKNNETMHSGYFDSEISPVTEESLKLRCKRRKKNKKRLEGDL